MPAQKETIKNRVFITSCPLCTLDMVRAWGFEPQRIAAQEPKGDVTLVKVFVVRYFIISRVRICGLPAISRKYSRL